MKRKAVLARVVVTTTLSASTLCAQGFIFPDDPIFNFTTVTVGPEATLTFAPNALNTPAVIRATGGIGVEGTVRVNGSDSTSLAGVGF